MDGEEWKKEAGEGRSPRHLSLHSESFPADKSVCFMNGSEWLGGGGGPPDNKDQQPFTHFEPYVRLFYKKASKQREKLIINKTHKKSICN